MDRFGARISLAVFVGWWSVANVLTGFANSVLSLEFYRALLGLGMAMLAMFLSPLVSRGSSANLSIALAALIVMAHLAWLTNTSTLVVDIVPQIALAKVFGLVAVGSSPGMIGMNKGVAFIIGAGSYDRWFGITGFLHVTAFLLLLSLWRRKADA